MADQEFHTFTMNENASVPLPDPAMECLLGWPNTVTPDLNFVFDEDKEWMMH